MCGLGGENDRPWYVDLGINLDHHFNPQLEGSIFLCSECWENLSTEITKDAQLFVHGLWQGVKPTYENKEPLIEDARDSGSPSEANREPEADNREPEPSNPTPTEGDRESSPDTLDGEDESKPNLRDFFNKGVGGFGDVR